jgi:hypothetical protein
MSRTSCLATRGVSRKLSSPERQRESLTKLDDPISQKPMHEVPVVEAPVRGRCFNACGRDTKFTGGGK